MALRQRRLISMGKTKRRRGKNGKFLTGSGGRRARKNRR